MSVSANFVQHTIEIALALYVSCECVLTVTQTHAAERAADAVPEGFEKHLSLDEFRTAAQYTVEEAQAQLWSTLGGAVFAIVMTFGNGLHAVSAFFTSLLGAGLTAQWCLIATVLMLMLLLELFVGWSVRYRLKVRYGYMTEPRGKWLRRAFTEAFCGWLVALPLTALFLYVAESLGHNWWKAAWLAWTLYLIWRWGFKRVWGIFLHRTTRPLNDPAAENRIRKLLASSGIAVTEFRVAARPDFWKGSHAVLAGFGRRRTAVIFARAAGKLTPDEMLVLFAQEACAVRHLHTLIRIVLHSAAGFLLAILGGWCASHEEFFLGLNFPASLSYGLTGSHAGAVLALALFCFPFLLYPLTPFINGIEHLLQYDADRKAAELCGTRTTVAAITRLEREQTNSLMPSRLYALFHLNRPHTGMRVAHLLRYASKNPAETGNSSQES